MHNAKNIPCPEFFFFKKKGKTKTLKIKGTYPDRDYPQQDHPKPKAGKTKTW